MGNYGIKKEDARLVTTKEKGKEVVANAFGGSLNVNPIYPVVLSATGIIDNQEVLDNQLSHCEQKLTGSSNAHTINVPIYSRSFQKWIFFLFAIGKPSTF